MEKSNLYLTYLEGEKLTKKPLSLSFFYGNTIFFQNILDVPGIIDSKRRMVATMINPCWIIGNGVKTVAMEVPMSIFLLESLKEGLLSDYTNTLNQGFLTIEKFLADFI